MMHGDLFIELGQGAGEREPQALGRRARRREEERSSLRRAPGPLPRQRSCKDYVRPEEAIRREEGRQSPVHAPCEHRRWQCALPLAAKQTLDDFHRPRRRGKPDPLQRPSGLRFQTLHRKRKMSSAFAFAKRVDFIDDDRTGIETIAPIRAWKEGRQGIRAL